MRNKVQRTGSLLFLPSPLTASDSDARMSDKKRRIQGGRLPGDICDVWRMR